jgi:hypothetical protein
MDLQETPITGLEELERHLQHLTESPETPLDAKLFDEVELQLTGMCALFLRGAHDPQQRQKPTFLCLFIRYMNAPSSASRFLT